MVSYIKGGMQAKRILRQIFGPRMDANGEGRRLYDDELHTLYCSPNIVKVIRRLRWAGHVARKEEDSSAFKILKGTYV